ncbi:MAG: hypothetical protein ACT4NY_23300 [Pseudonocardiales bacterium]
MAEAITTARGAGAGGLLIARMDSAFYSGVPIAACRRAGVRFSVTARMDRKIAKAIAGIAEDALRRERGLADLRRDRPQPAARRRHPRLAAPRHSPRLHPAPPTDQHPRPGSRTADAAT